jgi:chromosome segregation ATPase
VALALVVGAAGLLLGALMGWRLGLRHATGNSHRDWRTRVAARDSDLRTAQGALAEAAAEVEALRAESREIGRQLERAEAAVAELQAGSSAANGTGASAEIEALERELAEVEEELARARRAAAEPRGDPELRGRIEELESELATLESLRCRDPEAHRRDTGGR